MPKKNSPSVNLILPLCDLLMLFVLFLSILVTMYRGLGLTVGAFAQISLSFYKDFLISIFSWLLLSGYTKIYHDLNTAGTLTAFRRTIFQFIIYLVTILALLNNEKGLISYNKPGFVTFSIAFLFYLLVSRFVFIKYRKYRAKRGKGLTDSIILGINENTNELIELINSRKDLGYRLNVVFSNHHPKNKNINILSLSNLKNFISENKTDFAYISLAGEIEEEKINDLIELLQDKYIDFGFIPNSSLEARRSLEINYLDSFPILTYKKYPLEYPFNQITKRVFDLVFASMTFAILLWWLLPILSILIYFSQGRPIFYAQKRNGLNGKEFNCLKFRTMRPDKSNDKKPTERDDPRVTKLGRILRKTSLDELPQFFNVLKGDMSIVGPRPHMVSENESYAEIIKKYSLRHYVKPGITGLAQIRGYRGAIDSEKDMELRVRTDIYYVRNWSFLLDLLIIYKTVRLVLVGDENAI